MRKQAALAAGPPESLSTTRCASQPFDPFDAPEGAPAVLRQYGVGHWMATDWSQLAVIDRDTRKRIRTFATTDRVSADISADGKIVRSSRGNFDQSVRRRVVPLRSFRPPRA